MRQRWYIGSLFALKPNGMGGFAIRHKAGTQVASSDDEALGMFTRQAHEQYPTEQGYSNHNAVFGMVEASVIQEVIHLYAKQGIFFTCPQGGNDEL